MPLYEPKQSHDQWLFQATQQQLQNNHKFEPGVGKSNGDWTTQDDDDATAAFEDIYRAVESHNALLVCEMKGKVIFTHTPSLYLH